jgi:hypothetical protein
MDRSHAPGGVPDSRSNNEREIGHVAGLKVESWIG